MQANHEFKARLGYTEILDLKTPATTKLNLYPKHSLMAIFSPLPVQSVQNTISPSTPDSAAITVSQNVSN